MDGHNLFPLAPTDGRVGCCQYGAMMNRATLSLLIQMWMFIFDSCISTLKYAVPLGFVFRVWSEGGFGLCLLGKLTRRITPSGEIAAPPPTCVTSSCVLELVSGFPPDVRSGLVSPCFDDRAFSPRRSLAFLFYDSWPARFLRVWPDLQDKLPAAGECRRLSRHLA